MTNVAKSATAKRSPTSAAWATLGTARFGEQIEREICLTGANAPEIAATSTAAMSLTPFSLPPREGGEPPLSAWGGGPHALGSPRCSLCRAMGLVGIRCARQAHRRQSSFHES
jgi:hypothetical protein